jgi:hypothetical protein
VRRLKGLSRASAAFGGAQSAPLTDLSASAFRSLFQTMATRGVGVRFQGASAVQIALEPRGRRTTVDVAGAALDRWRSPEHPSTRFARSAKTRPLPAMTQTRPPPAAHTAGRRAQGLARRLGNNFIAYIIERPGGGVLRGV